MLVTTRGGVPNCDNVTVDGTGGAYAFKITDQTGKRESVPSRFVQISNEGANPLLLYFTLADFTAGTHKITLAATTGYFEGPVEAKSIWWKGSGGSTDATIVFYTGGVE